MVGTDPVAGSLIGGALSGFNSGPAGPAFSDAFGQSDSGLSVDIGGASLNKTKWHELLIAACVGGAVVWLVKA